jgi:L-ascorbate metabolism protein UlaG (beta-lactamase superfamily)
MASSSAQPVGLPTNFFPPAGLAYISDQQIDLSDNAVHKLTVPSGAVAAFVVPEGGNVRWRWGVDPTATVGTPLWGTASAWFGIVLLADVRFIEMTGSTTAKLNVTYFGGVSS